MIALLSVVGSPIAHAQELQAGEVAPELVLQMLTPEPVSRPLFRGRPTVLVFGEPRHTLTLDACREVVHRVNAAALREQNIDAILVVSEEADGDLGGLLAIQGYPRDIALDPQRNAFGTYEVIVTPTVVVMNADGVVIHRLFVRDPLFEAALHTALNIACGMEPPSALDNLFNPEPKPDESEQRATRFSRLARQLVARQMHDEALAQFDEALNEFPGHVPASLGKASLLVTLGKLDEAERIYVELQEREAEPLEVALGTARVLFERGDTFEERCVNIASELLDTNPTEHRIYLLLAKIEARNERWKSASEYYQKAFELLHQ